MGGVSVSPWMRFPVSGTTPSPCSTRCRASSFAGDALGTQGAAGLTLSGSLEEFGTALTEWRSETSGAYDTLYTSHNHQWHTRPAYVDSIQTAVASEPVTSPRPGYEAYRAGTGEALAWVFVPT